MTEKIYKIFTRFNKVANAEINYAAIYDGKKLVSLLNRVTGDRIPPNTRTFKKLASGHASFVEK